MDDDDATESLLFIAQGRLIDGGAENCREALPHLIKGLGNALEGKEVKSHLMTFRNQTQRDD